MTGGSFIVEAPDVPPNYLGYEITQAQTTLTPVDATNLAITLETHSGNVELHFNLAAGCTGDNGTLVFDIDIDGDTLREWWGYSFPDYGTVFVRCETNEFNSETFTAVIEGVPAGSHTFTLTWRCVFSAGSTVFAVSNMWPIVFSARELE